MNDPFQMQRELRYGAPVCDQILTGRFFTIGYSWYFRQAKWTLEIVDPGENLFAADAFRDPDVKRRDKFRSDVRIPKRFRAALNAFRDSGFDRGHLVASANSDQWHIQNSETFLLSNMSPQRPGFNRKIWRELEEAVRTLNKQEDVLETYVLNCPVFYFQEKIDTIGDEDDPFGIDVPVPHAFIKSVLAEFQDGKLKLWTFEMKNEDLSDNDDVTLGDFLVKTYDAEQLVGGRFWDRVAGGDMHAAKGGDKDKPIEEMWDY